MKTIEYKENDELWNVFASYTNYSFNFFMAHIIENENKGIFDDEFIKDFILSKIGKDNSIDCKVNYEMILENIGLLSLMYSMLLSFDNDTEIGINIAKSLIKSTNGFMVKYGSSFYDMDKYNSGYDDLIKNDIL